MKILLSNQIRDADAFTIAEENITSDQLMERASLVFTNWLLYNFKLSGTTCFFCGTGNNGGDGLCVARHLFQKGYPIQLVIVGDISTVSKDFTINLNRLKKQGFTNVNFYSEELDLKINEAEIIIDAIFGSGLNRRPEKIYDRAIQFINSTAATKIAIDLPSGLFADGTPSEVCVEADYTLSFELPKLAFFFPENHKYTGHWEIKSIGLSKKYVSEIQTIYHYVTEGDIRPILKQRNKFDHKGSFGHSLIIAGSPGTAGAAELAAYACLVSGSGLVTLSTDDDASGFPELMTVKRNDIVAQITNQKYSAIGIGPGLGTDVADLLKNILTVSKKPLVIDADALNMISAQNDLLKLIPANSILTPHPKEYERLFGKFEHEEKRLENQIDMSVRYKIIIICKRANSVITTPSGNVYFNSSGNPGMATAGSGDVLTGILTALIAQKYDTVHAALLGVYIHGLAGDIAMHQQSGQNLVSEDLIDYIPTAIEFISKPD